MSIFSPLFGNMFPVSDGLTKKRPGARKVREGHYLVFQGRAVSMKNLLS